MKQRIFKAAYIVLGAIVLLNALVVTFAANFNLGSLCAYLLAAVLISFGFLAHRLPMWLRAVFTALVLVGFSCVGTLIIGGSIDSATYSEDAMIVLGAGIRGDEPSYSLRLRLDRAAEFHEKNPDALIVVSGGQGFNEEYTEAFVMEKYLISKGVDPSVIIKEERSTSTEENFAFSKELLDDRLSDGYSVAYVTNSFHVYRAGCYARDVGLTRTSFLHAKTHPVTALPDGMRECLAILKLWILD